MRHGVVGLGTAVALAFGFGPAFPAARAPQAAFPFCEPFGSPPAWSDAWYAPWTFNGTPQGSVTWSLSATGGANDGSANTSYWHGVRNYEGSSVLVLQYPVPQNADIYVGCFMRCPSTYDPSPGENYWMESGFRMGAWSGQNFDDPATGGAWTVFKKFEWLRTGGLEKGNNDTWTWYSNPSPVNTGSNTAISIGFKLGNLYNTVTYRPPAPNFDVGWDGLCVSNQPMPTPPGVVSPPPPPVPPPAPPPSTGKNSRADHGLARCGCGSIAPETPLAATWAALALALGLVLLRRR